MGYTIMIGEAYLEYDAEGQRITIEVREQFNRDAPAFGEPTDYSNARWPSYAAWGEFCRSIGIEDLMQGEVEFEGECLMPLLDSHPGVAVITPQHVEYVRRRIEAYKALHPEHIAQYPPLKPDAKPIAPEVDQYLDSEYSDDPRFDRNLCRAEWLIYWMDWAVRNCDRPTFYNS